MKRAHKVAEHHGKTSGSARKALKNQMSNQISFDKARVWDINKWPNEENHPVEMIGEMMALDNQPFLMVEDLGFHRLTRHLAPSYPLPSRFHFSEKVVPNLYERAKKAIVDKLEAKSS